MVSMTGGSPGHHAIGIAVCDARTGSRIGIIRALIRSTTRFAFGLASLFFVLLTRKHQALHDIVCRTSVVLVHPDGLPDTERLSERITEDENCTYPSKLRRAMMIVIYIFLLLMTLSIFSTMIMSSESCLSSDLCLNMHAVIEQTANIAWLAGSLFIIVRGCQARLPGCRRRHGSQYAST